MSTRVQKGGPIFRPVTAKPRGRSTTGNTSRQSSVAADHRGSVAPGGTIDVLTPASMASIAMPPPSAIPSTVRSVSHGPRPSSSSVLPSIQAPTIANVQLAQPPTPSSSQSATTTVTAISAPTRSAPLPLAPGQSRSFPITVARSSVPSTPRATSVVAPPAPVDNSQLHSTNLPFNPVLFGPSPIHYHSSAFEQQPNSSEGDGSANSEYPQGLDVPGLPRLALNNDSVVKVVQPRRKSGRKKKATIEAGELASEGGEEAAQCETGKSTRPRKSRNVEEASAVGAEIQSTNTVANRAPDGPTKLAEEPSGTKRKRRSSSDPRKPRKSRGPSHPPFDADADPGEELDPTIVTMATLCSDTGQGRISSKAVQIQNNHIAWKASNREKRARMKMVMENKKYGKKDGADEAVAGTQVTNKPPAENTVFGNAGAGPSNQSASGSVRASSAGPVPEDETGQGFDYSQSMSTSRFNVQVRIGPNGETIIDEESLFVDRVDENETVNYTHVEESDTTKFVNSSTYGKKFRGSRWSGEETELFFDALSQFGENYELISYVLPGRDRKACKNKFKAEDRKNPNRITYCLNNRIPYDMQTLSRMTGKDFSGPTPEIHAPAVLSLAETDKPEGDEPSESTRKTSATPGLASDGAEVLGDAASFDKDDDA